MAKRCCDVFREHHKRLCDILHASSTVLASFSIALYAKKIIDVKTKSEVLRMKGFEGADALLDHVLLKLQADPKRFTIVLEVIVAEDALSDVGNEMESLYLRQNLTVCNRRIPIVEAPTTDAIGFAKHLKSAYEELVDVIYDSVRNVDVGKLRVRLNVFFMSDEHMDADNTLLCKLDSCKTTEDVLLCLIRANFIGYLNYKLLQVFAKASSNEQALKSIDDYEKEYLKLFKCDFASLIKLFRNPRLTNIPPVSLPEFTVRLGSTNDQSDLYSFKDFFENRFSWAEHLLILDVEKSCILVKYGVLPFFISAVARDLTDPAILEELRKKDIAIELSPQFKDIARHHDQLVFEVLPSLHDISSSDVSLFLRSHDLAITDTQKYQLRTSVTSVAHTSTDEDHESQVGTIVSDNSKSLEAIELKGLPVEKMISDWDKHETNSSSGFHEDLQSLGLCIKEDTRLAEKVFVYEKALKKLLDERKKLEAKNEIHRKVLIELEETKAELAKERRRNCERNKKTKDETSQSHDQRKAKLHENEQKGSRTYESVRGTKDEVLSQKKEQFETKLQQKFSQADDRSSQRSFRTRREQDEFRMHHDHDDERKKTHLVPAIGFPSQMRSLYFGTQDSFEYGYGYDTLRKERSQTEERIPALIDLDYARLNVASDHPAPPTVGSMCEVLKDLVDWERVAQHVPGITSEKIHEIKGRWHSSNSLDKQKHHFFGQWLLCHSNLSWNDVFGVLMKAGEYKLAIKIDDRFNTKISDHPPTCIVASDVCEILKDLVDWERLASHVPGITREMIQRIKRRGYSSLNMRHHFFDLWLLTYPNLSWNDIIDALMKAGEYKLAIEVDAHYPYEKMEYVPLTVDSMCTLLYDVMNWEQFAIHLPNITSSDVERIQLNYHHSVHDCERALVKYWLSVHPKASWDDVMIALHEAGEQKLARNVMDMRNLHPLELHRQLETLNDWEKFGLELTGITWSDIEHIKSQYDGLSSRKLALYHKWISKCHNDHLSWKSVAHALSFEYKLVQDIRNKYSL